MCYYTFWPKPNFFNHPFFKMYLSIYVFLLLQSMSSLGTTLSSLIEACLLGLLFDGRLPIDHLKSKHNPFLA
jgi:hypothetical protein